MGIKTENKKVRQCKMSEKKIMQGKTQRRKLMPKMGLILILNQNCNSSRKVFQNAPNGLPYGNGPPAHFNTTGLVCGTRNKITETSKTQPECLHLG